MSQFVDDGRDHPTRAAPWCPEIDQHRNWRLQNNFLPAIIIDGTSTYIEYSFNFPVNGDVLFFRLFLSAGLRDAGYSVRAITNHPPAAVPADTPSALARIVEIDLLCLIWEAGDANRAFTPTRGRVLNATFIFTGLTVPETAAVTIL